MRPALDPACQAWLQEPLVLGLSGGRDSVALLLALLEQGCCVFACHVQHGIRGAAAEEDAAFCAALCERLGVPFEEIRIDVPTLARQSRESLETAARKARRAALADCARRHGCRSIALAQHADDQAETVLFHLARGSAGPRGIRPVHAAEGMLWLRPLLSCPREELTAWLLARGQDWREDASNAEPDITRNRLRHELLPLYQNIMGRDVRPILLRSARLQEENLQALEEALAALPLCDPQGRLYLPALADKSPAFCKAALLRYLRLAGVPDVSEAMLRSLLEMLPADAPCAARDLPQGYRARRKEKRFFLCRHGEALPVAW